MRGRDGQGLSDPEVRDQVVALIAAGYETTSAAMAWAVRFLLSAPELSARARAEVREVLVGRWPVRADLSRLTYLNGVVHETLRLCPPAVVVPRAVVEDFTFAGRRIRAGRTLLYRPYVTHRLPEVWPDPLRFQPERWHRKPGPDEFLPFGGGPHRCVGAVLATTELTVLPGRPRPTSVAAMRPRDGVPARVLRRSAGPGG